MHVICLNSLMVILTILHCKGSMSFLYRWPRALGVILQWMLQLSWDCWRAFGTSKVGEKMGTCRQLCHAPNLYNLLEFAQGLSPPKIHFLWSLDSLKKQRFVKIQLGSPIVISTKLWFSHGAFDLWESMPSLVLLVKILRWIQSKMKVTECHLALRLYSTLQKTINM